jgi:hypothetical protein
MSNENCDISLQGRSIVRLAEGIEPRGSDGLRFYQRGGLSQEKQKQF